MTGHLLSVVRARVRVPLRDLAPSPDEALAGRLQIGWIHGGFCAFAAIARAVITIT